MPRVKGVTTFYLQHSDETTFKRRVNLIEPTVEMSRNNRESFYINKQRQFLPKVFKYMYRRETILNTHI